MAKQSKWPKPAGGTMHVAVENEDWVAIGGTSAELKELGRLMAEFAEGQRCLAFGSESVVNQPAMMP